MNRKEGAIGQLEYLYKEWSYHLAPHRGGMAWHGIGSVRRVLNGKTVQEHKIRLVCYIKTIFMLIDG